LGSFAVLKEVCGANPSARLNLKLGLDFFLLGDCDICAGQKILFINKMKRYEIWSRPKG
jgi:hypothetical protein